jgi:uncharacterized protein YqhQ
MRTFMKNKNKLGSSGIGGQAVIEGIMMRNKDWYSVAVRKRKFWELLLSEEYLVLLIP